jgi:hypothetical protein
MRPAAGGDGQTKLASMDDEVGTLQDGEPPRSSGRTAACTGVPPARLSR